MAPKRKQTKAAGEPAAKEAKTEEPSKEEKKAEEEPKEEPAAAAAAEEPKEKEQDDKKDTRPQIKEPVCFQGAETTLNVVPANGGNVLMALSDGGMQFLIAGARASAGVKSGRYFYEVKVIEALVPAEGYAQGRARVPMPRQLVRLGFSLGGSSLILGDGGDSCVCFDAEGFFYADKKRSSVSMRFGRNQALGVLINLDAKSPNANTVSLFCDGQRVSEPQPLPEKLKGEVLFPHVSFRNVSLHVNFGPQPMSALPFKCRMLQEAAVADVKEVKAEKPKDGKYEVLFPVAFPDEGTFEWLDGFLEKNPNYTELSDRKIMDWAVKSGVWKPKSYGWKHSNDKPEYNFGLQHMDDFSIRRCLNSVTSVVPRNYVVMEVKQNLTQADRQQNLKRFKAPHFKKIAHVVMGEPPKEYRAKVHKKVLEEKQSKAEVDWRMRKIEKERKRAIAQRQKEIAEQKAAAEKKRKEAEEEAKKKAEEEAKKKAAEEAEKKEEGDAKEGEAAPEKEEEKKEEEKKEEQETKEEEKKEEKKEEEAPAAEEKKEEEEEDVDEPMPQVELSEEEKKLNFKPPTSCDIALHVLNTIFGDFCIPEKQEGFDEVRYEWQNEANSKAYLQKWVKEKKVTARIEDLNPGETFKTKLEEFQKMTKEWQAKQKEFKAKKATEAAEKKTAEGAKDGEEEVEEKMDVDIQSVEDICDVGGGEPLFAEFSFEDWAMLTLRFELHLLQASFTEDAKDPERIGIHENHLLFYYSKYYKKQLSSSLYGKDTPQEVVDLVKDAVKFDSESKVLVSTLKDEPVVISIFVKLQEENRRKRQQRIDAGDETARLNFRLLQSQEASGQSWSHKGGKGKDWRHKGAGKAAEASQPPPPPPAGAPPAPTVVAPPAPPPGGGPRLVPAPRSKGWKAGEQGQKGGEKGDWQSGKAGGKQPQYAPRVGGKAGKK